MKLGEYPSEGWDQTEYGMFEWKALLTPDNWFVVKYYYLMFGVKHEACGKGRSMDVANKFALQALKKGLSC